MGEEFKPIPKEVNPEVKKQETTPLFFIYRDNDLFRSIIPGVEEELKSEQTVDSHVFDQETELETIKKWIEENKDVFSDKVVIVDKTTFNQGLSNNRNTKQLLKLDNSITEAARRAVFGKDLAEQTTWWGSRNELEKEKSLEQRIEESGWCFVEMVKKILEEPNNQPQKVIILTDKITEHSALFNGCEGELFRGEKRKQASMRVASKLREWLSEAGIDSDKIVIEPEISYLRPDYSEVLTEEGVKLIPEVDQESNWIIVDRHARFRGTDGKSRVEFQKAKVLRLPEANFLDDAQEQGLLHIESGLLSANLKDILKEELSTNE